MNLPEATFSTYLLCLLHRVVSTKIFSIKFLFTKNFSRISLLYVNNNCSKISAFIYSVVIEDYFPLTHEILFINVLVLKVSLT